MRTVGKENGMAENDLGEKTRKLINATKGLGVCLGHLNRERGTIVFSGVLNSAKGGLKLIKQRNSSKS
jgi:hypothetical protein